MPINGPSIICVGETALILDGSLKGNSKLREVRHPAPEEREKFIAQSSGRPPMTMDTELCAPIGRNSLYVHGIVIWDGDRKVL